jgi:hypothetical protein
MGDIIFNALEGRSKAFYLSYDVKSRKRTPKENAANTFAKNLKGIMEISDSSAEKIANAWSNFDSFEHMNYKMMATLYKLIYDTDGKISIDMFEPSKGHLDKEYIPKILPKPNYMADLDDTSRRLVKIRIYAAFFRYYNWYRANGGK